MKIFRRVLWLLPLVYMMMIWKMSSQPDNTYVELPDSTVDAYMKESLHLIEFAILYLLFVWVASINQKLTRGSNLVFVVVACLYGLTDEIHQSFVPSRSATVIDFIKDITGVAIAYYIIRKKKMSH